jgi:hypothetical protein
VRDRQICALHGVSQERCVKPSVLMAGQDEKAPALAKPEHRQHLRTPTDQMVEMSRHEEIAVFAEYITRPNEPPRSRTSSVSKTVERNYSRTNVSRYSRDRIELSIDERRVVAFANRHHLFG